MKIKFCAHWCSTHEITERIIKQFLTSESDLAGFEIVHDNSYDVIVFFNHINDQVKENAKIYLFANEPTWSGSHQKNIDGIQNIKYFTFDKSYYSPNHNIIETPSRCFYGGRGPWCDTYDTWSHENLKNYSPQKTKNISSVVTTWSVNVGMECLYSNRYRLIENIIDKADFVDFFGGWSNKSNTFTSQKKIDALRDYKFNLVIENQYINNWVTEKFYDCVLTDTIPIYYGCKNIKNIWPSDAYILLDNIDDVNYVYDVLQNIQSNCDDIYNSKLSHLRKIKTDYFNEYNLLKFIIKNIKQDFNI